MLSNQEIDFKEMEHTVRKVLADHNMNEPRHYTMTLALVTGLFLQYPVWLVGQKSEHKERLEDIAKQLGFVVRAVALLDEATPAFAKLTPELN